MSIVHSLSQPPHFSPLSLHIDTPLLYKFLCLIQDLSLFSPPPCPTSISLPPTLFMCFTFAFTVSSLLSSLVVEYSLWSLLSHLVFLVTCPAFRPFHVLDFSPFVSLRLFLLSKPVTGFNSPPLI